MTVLEWVADRMADQPFAFGRGVFEPGVAERKDQGGVILGDIAQVICDAAADVEIGVVFEGLEDGQHRGRVFDERRNPLGPG